MEKNKPISYSDLRMNIAKEAWSIWCPTRPLPAIPAEFFNIADYAIKVPSLYVTTIAEDVDCKFNAVLEPFKKN